MLTTTQMKDKLERFGRFWRRAPTDRPALGLRLKSYFPMQDFAGLPQAGAITPEDLTIEHHFEDCDRLCALYDQALGDQIYVASAFRGVPWMEAILGCAIEASPSSMWARPALADWSDLHSIEFRADNPWFLKLLELTAQLVHYAGGRFPVGMPLLRGPSDVAAALRGTETFCTDLLSEPANVQALLDICTDAYLEVTGALFETCGTWHGGTCEQIRHIWAPGRCCQTQADVSSMLSARHYRRFIRPCDARVLHAYDYAFIHMHTSSLHVLDDILAIEPLAAVQLSVDVGGPRPDQMLEPIKRVLAKTALILQVDGKDYNADDVVWLCERLPAAGFYIMVLGHGLEKANGLAEEVFGRLGWAC